MDVSLAVRLHEMWEDHLTRFYGVAEFGIVHPMEAPIMISIWARVRDFMLGSPHQMA